MGGGNYDLGPTPRPVLVRFLSDANVWSAAYVVSGTLIDIPAGVSAIDINQMPLFPQDYPEANEPGWGNTGDPVQIRPGEGTVRRVQVRGPEHFRPA